jgi:DNA-binding MarR family transcriptional regulator
MAFPHYFYEERRPKTGFHIRETHLVIMQAIRERLRPFGIPPGQAILLTTLVREDGVSQIDLGVRMGVPPSQVAATVRKLEKSRHIVRKRNSKDQRQILIYLTPKGRKVDKITQRVLEEVTEICLAGLSEMQTAALIKTLTKIRHNVLKTLDRSGNRAMRGPS